jgi:hypothetical protein
MGVEYVGFYSNPIRLSIILFGIFMYNYMIWQQKSVIKWVFDFFFWKCWSNGWFLLPHHPVV